ncbi:catalase [Neorhizobium sp. AL 9.2.2]|uniref:catalase n=1 Tax=Neorhizobium sp. AL 9.2.2 TaxID=2712894 RepID=UPI001FCEE36F|nr:catalase [Neorhizobium sp. AL 9.2.2]
MKALNLCAAGLLAGLAASANTGMPSDAIAADAQTIVEALKTVAGNPEGVRATFAKGQCVHGTYTPEPNAGRVTASKSFTQSWPVIGRFSVSGGNPKVADSSRTALRGLSIKILSGNDESHVLFENAPVHFAKTLDQMLGFLQARAPAADGKPDPARIAAFARDNPETARQAAFIKDELLPASYAGIVYWGVHVFTGINENGNKVPFKFKVQPRAGELTISDAEAANKPASFLVSELADRIKEGPATFDIIAILAEPNDRHDDVTVRWTNEDTHSMVTIGNVSITGLEPNDTCDQTIFDPGRLAVGINPPADEIFSARTTAYAISLGLRSK